MTETAQRFRVNTESVAAKVIDGEAIIINLETGVYYSLDGVGGEVWSLLEGHHPVDAVVASLATRYGASEEQCRADVQSLVGQLTDEGLVVPTEALPEGSPMAEMSPAADGYAPPRLNVYRDMGDLLALDPPVPGLEPIPWDDPLEQRDSGAPI
ncbi:MAG: PqqD family protein [Gemmatimonadota bacterium]